MLWHHSRIQLELHASIPCYSFAQHCYWIDFLCLRPLLFAVLPYCDMILNLYKTINLRVLFSSRIVATGVNYFRINSVWVKCRDRYFFLCSREQNAIAYRSLFVVTKMVWFEMVRLPFYAIIHCVEWVAHYPKSPMYLVPQVPSTGKFLNGYPMFSVKNIVQNVILHRVMGQNFGTIIFCPL